jgi:membrane protease YdiL (CAAX protease family)
MDNRFDLIRFLVIVTVASIFWGRINRIGYSQFINSIVHFMMKYSKMNAELIRSYLVWFIYMFAGLLAAVALLLTYRVNLLRFLTLNPRYFTLVPLVFIAQNSLTGLMMHLLIVAKPTMDVLFELTSIPWVRYTLMMPGIMRVISPLGAAICEEVFFRGTVFLVLINNFPQTGACFPILVCTVLFVAQQVLQTDTFGQGLILLIGSTSISIVGCIATLYTGSFLPTLLCHAAYAFFYLQLGTSMPKSNPKSQRSKPGSAYPGF